MFTLIKCPLLSKHYLETFILMAEKKNEDGSQCLLDENFEGEIKKAFKEQDILT